MKTYINHTSFNKIYVGGTKDMKEKNKKIEYKQIVYIILIISLILILIFIFQKTYENLLKQKKFEDSIISFAEKNEETVFTIEKIVFFSSSDSKNKASSPTNFTIENLYTYTDIAIFIDNHSEENTVKNTLKSLKITNIKFNKEPLYGKPNLYFKSINNFAKSELIDSNLIESEMIFNITSENEANLNNPILYNNCANPITMSYINQNIKTDYTMLDIENPITYNGKLLERCGVAISSIETSISFDIEIENNKDEKYKTTVYFNIPYQFEEKSIYDGNLTLTKNVKFDFYRYD